MSRTYAHKPFAVVDPTPVWGGPRQDPDAPWLYTPGTLDQMMSWREARRYYGRPRADSAGARQQRRAMRRKRHTVDHMLTRDPLRYEDMTSTVEKIDKWALPSW